MLNENNYISIINGYSKKDWEPLLSLIPEIENTSQFGVINGKEFDENGILIMPYYIPSSVVIRFNKIVYNLPIIINFDWSGWSNGHIMVSDNKFNFDTIDIPEKCKIITAIVRNNRFCDGALISAFESGLILRLLKSIKNQL